MRRYDNFSDHDFELFVADLLGAELGLRFEAFPRGADGGVDLRALIPRRSRPHVVQCKHYVHSSFSTLLRAARVESERLAKLRPQPATYRFVTSRRLTAGGKARIAEVLRPWVRADDDVLGAHDLELLLNRHPEVERRQVKLWLTGGTQLAALLHSGTVARSQTLLDEIERAMPRYVQGAVFGEARQQLRAERVLVIAGVPGIGKTTLARILLADAVLDGYEPIDISRDIEEAWELAEPGVKQIFLYDDFLGRTALEERFAKNEDRRLIDFMRRATRGRSTLFVLTTREYILRQAAQLYERLDQERVGGRRLLLELPSYSRLDRARIFANHAFHSTQLNTQTKQELVTDEAYGRIIDHPNYSPRTIEWITGMSGHDLQARELANYVDFAVDALEHPERVWQHAFEREIDGHGRALLFALASLPERVELDHLGRAFEEVCRVSHLSLSGRAFERTLAALDDSFLRTLHDDADRWENRGVLASPYDPSVVDFLSDYLRRSPGDAQRLALASLFFEQVEWLAATLRRSSGTPPAWLLDDLADAVARTFESPGLRVVRMPVAPNSWTQRPRGTRDVESRLLAVHGLLEVGAAWRERFETWWRTAFTETVRRWQQGEAHPPSVLELLRVVRDDEVDLSAALDAAKGALRTGWSFVQQFEWLIQLRNEFPDAFTSKESAELADEFASWAASGLADHAQDMSTEEELAAVERVAEQLGIFLDEDDLNEAEETVRENMAQQESEIERDDDWDGRGPARDFRSERREVEAIFIRLAEDG